ncbi:MAG: class I SAM-dependent methyltransferase [Microgenomates group bacterium]
MSVPYDSFDYPGFWINRSFEDKCERIALTRFFKRTKKGKLLDIGGGFGRLANLYALFFDSCIIFEPSRELIRIGKKKLSLFSNLKFEQGSLPFLPFDSATFDVALMVRVSHHLPVLLPSFKEVYRVLKDDGYFVLEIANKIHFLARTKAFFRGDFSFVDSLAPLERRSEESIKKGNILFLNHHPWQVEQDLEKAGFVILEKLSVSNFRHHFIKRVFPNFLLLFFEKWLQKPLSRIYFGPSIFYLCIKKS